MLFVVYYAFSYKTIANRLLHKCLIWSAPVCRVRMVLIVIEDLTIGPVTTR